MKSSTIAMVVMILMMILPVTTMAMNHGSHDKDMASGMSDMEHKGHDMDDMHKGHDMQSMAEHSDDFVEIGKDTQSGVVATVKVKTYDEKTLATMAKMGMDATHHVMVFFADEKSGEEIDSGKAALKFKDQQGKPVMLMQMGAGFGSDVSIGEGMHTLEIGTKLSDGKQRQFSIMFHNM